MRQCSAMTPDLGSNAATADAAAVGLVRRVMKVLRMDMDDVVQTDALLGFMFLYAVSAIIAGALIAARVIAWPLWVGICGIVGGVLTIRSVAHARRLFRSRRNAQQ